MRPARACAQTQSVLTPSRWATSSAVRSLSMPRGSQMPSRMNRYDAERRMPHLLFAGQIAGYERGRPCHWTGQGASRSGARLAPVWAVSSLEEEHAASKIDGQLMDTT